MIINDLDRVSGSPVYYDIYDSDHHIIDWFRRDKNKDPEDYRIDNAKFELYRDCVIFHIYTLNDIIRVMAHGPDVWRE